jgi:hypothetical protein
MPPEPVAGFSQHGVELVVLVFSQQESVANRGSAFWKDPTGKTARKGQRNGLSFDPTGQLKRGRDAAL